MRKMFDSFDGCSSLSFMTVRQSETLCVLLGMCLIQMLTITNHLAEFISSLTAHFMLDLIS